jgi:hypothetical protein
MLTQDEINDLLDYGFEPDTSDLADAEYFDYYSIGEGFTASWNVEKHYGYIQWVPCGTVYDIGDEDSNLAHFLGSVSQYEVSPWSLRGQGLEAAGFDEVERDLWVKSNNNCTATYDDSEFYGTGKVEYANGEVVDGLSFDEWIAELDSSGLL